MPKTPGKKRHGVVQAHPYAKSGVVHNLFKMKTEIGQHVLKNPGVAQALVDKADLKQSDVSASGQVAPFFSSNFVRNSPMLHFLSRV